MATLGTRVTTYALHPGTVHTELTRHAQDSMPLSWRILFLVMCSPIGNFFRKTAMEGAQTTIYCAVSEELKDTTGKYYR